MLVIWNVILQIQFTQMKAIFKTFSSNEIFLWSFVAIDYNHVEFSLILTQGT